MHISNLLYHVHMINIEKCVIHLIKLLSLKYVMYFT